MNPISDKNLSRAGKSIVWIMFLGGLFYYALSKFGVIGMNLGGIEQIILIALGLFLLSETVLEDKAKLKKLNLCWVF